MCQRGMRLWMYNKTYVSVVDFKDVKANVYRALDGLQPSLLQILNVVLGHLLDRGMLLVPGDGTRAVHVVGPAVHLLRFSMQTKSGLVIPTSLVATSPELIQGATVEAFLPAWAIWSAIFWP